MQQNFVNIIIIVISICCINFCFANVNLSFNAIEDGLTDDRFNYFIFQDSRGFVWISSIDGLNRFDGMQIKNYRAESGLKSNNIQSNFFEDNSGRIWFTTYEAINYYNPVDDTIRYDIIANETSDYKAFYLDKYNNLLWLRAGNKIYTYNVNQKAVDNIVLDNIPSTSKTFKLVTDTKGVLKKIIMPMPPNLVWLINLENETFKEVYDVPNFADIVYLEDDHWLFYSTNNSTFTLDFNFPHDILFTENNRNENVQSSIKYDNENHFVSTKENGLWLYNYKTGVFKKHWRHDSQIKNSLLSNEPFDLHISTLKNGNEEQNYLWISHSGKGINYAALNKNGFSNPIHDLLQEAVDVSAVMQTKAGNIWVTTKKYGVYVFTEKGSLIHNFNDEFDTSLLWNTVELNNEICLTSSTNAIYLLNLNNKEVKPLTFDLKSPSYRFMINIFPNRYLVTTQNGVMEIEQYEKNKFNLKHCKAFEKNKTFSFLQLFQTLDNKLFVPYNDSELWIYQATQDSLQLLTKKDSFNLRFFGFNESVSKPGVVWAGTSNGLKMINEQNNVKSYFTGISALDNGNVYGVVEDRKGFLWLSTNKGLWKYDLNNYLEKTIHFEAIDGLSSELFSLFHSAIYTSNGTIWMGNSKGLTKFHPDSITIHKEKPKIHLEDLLINDTQSFKNFITKENILNLNYDQKTLTFDIRAVNLYKTEQNKIHYQLEDYDDKWLKISNGEKIRYTKISPGEYNLKVQAEDANGHKSNFKQLLAINIKPPYWQTRWFYALCTLLTLLFIYVVYRVRVYYILQEENKKREIEKLEAKVLLEAETKKREIEKIKAQALIEEEAKKREIEKIKAQALIEEEAKKTELEKLKNQVLEVEMKALRAQMNPHFLFNSLNSIKSLILQTKEEEASAYLSKFSTLLRSILNYSEKQKIKLSEEIEALRLYIELESLRFDSDFNYQIQIDKTIDGSFIRIPPLILQPFAENAIWHGLLPIKEGQHKLNINIIRKKDFLFFEIEDNGVGRKKASTLPKKENEKSMGIDITKKRIQLLHPENDIEIIDLVDNNQQALGTKVVIKLFAPE